MRRFGINALIVSLIVAWAVAGSPAPLSASTVLGPSIAAGLDHTVSVRSDGTIWAFGRNYHGQLGTTTNNGTGTPNPTPTQVPGLTDISAVTAGAAHTAALRADGTVWAFGANDFGQLGTTTNNNTIVPNPTPTQVPGLTGITAIAAGESFTVALRSDGTVWAFGNNLDGQLGTTTNNNTFFPNPTPTQVPGLTGITAIAAKDSHTIALRSDGTVWAFGGNFSGELGRPANNGTNNANPTPTLVPGLTGITAIAAGSSHTIALRSDGTVWAFGNNFYGELGRPANNGTNNANPTPTQVPGLTGITAITAGTFHTIALGTNGAVWAFGDNYYGQLATATNNTTFNPNPTPVPTTLAATSVSASRFVVVSPTRILDTRPDSTINYAGAKPAPGSSTIVNVIGRATIPAGATAITANVTITEATAPGFVQAFPTGVGTPGASSNLNVERAGQTIPNAVTVPIGIDGTITLFAQSGGHLLLDVTGYFIPTAAPPAAGRLIPVTPTRILDTRPASAVNYSSAKPVAGSITRVRATGITPIPASGVAAVVLNVTATEATAPGFIQLGAASQLAPGASSNLNVEYSGQTIPNQVIVPVSPGGEIEFYTQAGTHLLLDVTAYITSASAVPGTDGLFVPITPTRVLDTRPASVVGHSGALPGPGSTTRVDAVAASAISGAGAAAVAANITLTEASAPGFVQAAAAGTLVPGASSIVNANTAGQTIPNAAIVPVTGGRFDLFTQAGGHLLADVFGYFTD